MARPQRKKHPVGSKNKDCHGYVRVKTKPGADRWEKEHTLVMEWHIGRRLKRGETVHHINGIRDDNRLVNLHLCSNTSDHSKIEASAAALAKKLLQVGLVIFNREKKIYELAT